MSIGSHAQVAVRVRATVASHRGRVRSRNEDCVGVAGWTPIGEAPVSLELPVRDQPLVAVIADGAGGHPAGDVASRVVVHALMRRSRSLLSTQALEQAIGAAHDELHTHGREHPEWSGMGSTVAALVITPGAVLVGNVGDSRVYEVIEGEPVQLSTDDSPERPDFISAERSTSTLTQMLGGPPGSSVTVHTAHYDAEAGLGFLLCSDGLTCCVDEPTIADVLARAGSARAITDELLGAALAAGAPDNVSIIHLRTERATEGVIR